MLITIKSCGVSAFPWTCFSMVLFLMAAFTLAQQVEVVPITHASLILKWNGKAVYVDPWSQGNYEGQPKADLILITDIHPDHLDLRQVAAVRKPDTSIVAPPAAQSSIAEARFLKNGEKAEVLGIGITAVPAYNLLRGPSAGQHFHPKGRGNGYLLEMSGKRIYVSGDTECIPEMKQLKNIDMAFICMNLPYTMPPEEAAQCVNEFRPKVVYPYHYRGSDLQVFKKAVTAPGVEVKLANWYPGETQ
ncbi:MAG: MBL fold metallo-hydrolase [Acidobacteriota bacterium]